MFDIYGTSTTYLRWDNPRRGIAFLDFTRATHRTLPRREKLSSRLLSLFAASKPNAVSRASSWDRRCGWEKRIHTHTHITHTYTHTTHVPTTVVARRHWPTLLHLVDMEMRNNGGEWTNHVMPRSAISNRRISLATAQAAAFCP